MEAATTLLGAIVVFAVGFLNINWKKVWGDVAIVTVAAVSSILLYVMSITDEIWVAYIGKSGLVVILSKLDIGLDIDFYCRLPGVSNGLSGIDDCGHI